MTAHKTEQSDSEILAARYKMALEAIIAANTSTKQMQNIARYALYGVLKNDQS